MKNYNIIKNPSISDWETLSERATSEAQEIEQRVIDVLKKVKGEGNKALKEYTHQFDGVSLGNFQVSQEEMEEAKTQIPEELKEAIQQAYQNIEKFHQSQKTAIIKIETQKGITCWRKNIPIQKVGFYIPGGTAPLFSTVLMLGVPAQIADCPEVILCSPPNKEGKIHPAILFTANLVGVSKIFKVGGGQAIAAMGYGTETIPQVYKIFGPGNQYVTAAKMLLAKEGLAIDMPAGPSEVLVLADETANPAFVASDLLSQAEHGVDSQVVLVTDSESFIQKTLAQVETQLAALPRAEIARQSLENSRFLVFDSLGQGMNFSNFYAPEHLIIASKDYESLAEKVTQAGSVFLGNYSPESVGDYASGTNHTLPTNGYAQAFSGVSLDSFYKKVTFQHLTQQGLKGIAKTVETMAAAEGLEAHKNAVKIRRS